MTVWWSSDAITAWTPRRSGRRGRQRRYSDLAIETVLTLRLLAHLPRRQAEGFRHVLFGRRRLDLSAPDETTRSRRAVRMGGAVGDGSRTARAAVSCSTARGWQTVEIDTAFIDPGKPWQNGTDESFNGKFRNECLSLEWFRNRMEAKIGIERWRRHYNEERPHMSLGDLTPADFKKQMGTTHDWLGESLTGVILQ